MARISMAERLRLGRLRPELWEKLLELNDRANSDLGFTLAVPQDGGTRTIARQEQLYQDALLEGGGHQTAYAVGAPGKSRHNYGAAFDVHIVAGGSADDGTGSEEDYRRLADVGEAIGLVAGDYFAERGEGKRDPYHFQLDEELQVSIDRWNAMKKAGIVTAAAIVAAVFGLSALRS